MTDNDLLALTTRIAQLELRLEDLAAFVAVNLPHKDNPC
jgi:hypothetical protein